MGEQRIGEGFKQEIVLETSFFCPQSLHFSREICCVVWRQKAAYVAEVATVLDLAW